MQEQNNYASYQQLEEFLDQSQQKAFWIFSFGQVVGLFAGLFVGRLVGALLPHALGGLLGTPLLLAGALLGVIATWKVKGQPIYALTWNYLSFYVKRLLRLAPMVVSSADIYETPAESVAPVEWSQDGRPSFHYAGEEVPVEVRAGRFSGEGER